MDLGLFNGCLVLFLFILAFVVMIRESQSKKGADHEKETNETWDQDHHY
jgi:hypothetical protein